MKHAILCASILLGMIVSLNTQATVYIVSNNNPSGAQFTSLSAAKAAASAGDTLLVEGTNIPYSFTNCDLWNKQLVVIGIGYNPDKIDPKRTIISNNAFGTCSNIPFPNNPANAFVITSGGNGSKFYGIQFNSAVRMALGTVSNYYFEGCSFYSGVTFSSSPNSSVPTGINANNFSFVNCIFSADVSGSTSIEFSPGNFSNSNILVSNCVLDGRIFGWSNSLHSITIDHCVFLEHGNNIYDGPIQQVRNAIIKNSIFMNAVYLLGSSQSCTFINNISRLGGFPSGSQNTGNISNTNPNFIKYNVNNLGTRYHPSYDFDVQTGSAAIGAATDNTDIGVHGGNSNFSESGEVLITPIVRSVTLTNANVSPNGTINVQIKAGKPHED